MLCGNCKKNQATKTYERIKNGKKALDYYCLDCYHRLFIDADKGGENALSVCPYCGATAETVRKRNLAGCAKCYETLEGVLYPIVKKMQGGQVHSGKQPVGGERERVRKRCNELKMIIDKLNTDGDFDGARAYTGRLSELQSGQVEEEDYVWRKHPRLFKRS